MGEQPIYTTKAHVFQIDPSTKKKWIPASSQAVNVSYYYDKSRNTYRIISVDGTNAVINSTITPNMNFTKTSQKFGQWSDSRAGTVYGLGFANEADCTNFVDKFKEVKELTKKTQPVSNNNTPTPKPPTPILTNSNQANGDIVPASETETSSVSSVSAAKRPSTPTMSSQISSDSHNAEKRNSNSSLSAASLPTGSLIDQLKYENDRLKIALAQSSANAKKWEVELQTLKNNNARLTTALQESTANVEEWKKQLSAYKEESARMKKKVIEMEKLGGSEASQKQMSELREQVEELETANSRKDQEITDLTKKVETAKLAQAETQRLQRRIQELEKQQEVQLRQVSDLRGELDIVQSSRTQDKLKLRQLQEQLSTKLKEVLSLSENMDQLSV